jgi:hypothetical protein
MKILKLALLILICKDLSSQIYNYPQINNRNYQSTSILKVEINDKYTIVEEEYKCSYIYDSGYFSISNNSFIKSNGRYYKLLKTEGIAVSPNKTYCKQKGSSYKYKLFFEKIKPSKKIDVIEDSINGGFNFYDVELINNKEQSEWNMAKTDKFVKFLPVVFYNVFLYADFVNYKDGIIKFFNETIENNETTSISKIIYNEDEEFKSYKCEIRNLEVDFDIEFFMRDKSKLKNGFDQICFYFKDRNKAKEFYNNYLDYHVFSNVENENISLKVFFMQDDAYHVIAGLDESDNSQTTLKLVIKDSNSFFENIINDRTK